MRRGLRWLRDSLVSGLLVVFPLGLTLYVLWLLYRLLRLVVGPDTPFAQLLVRTFGRYLPGTEVVLTLLALLLVGAVARHWAGRAILGALDRFVMALPGVRKIYWATRQLSRALIRRELAPGGLRRLVLLEYPREGYYVMGVLTNERVEPLQETVGGDCVSVYIPTAPNPLSGWVFFVPKGRVIPLDIPFDEGLTLILSGGVVAPEQGRRHHKPQEESDAHPSG